MNLCVALPFLPSEYFKNPNLIAYCISATLRCFIITADGYMVLSFRALTNQLV